MSKSFKDLVQKYHFEAKAYEAIYNLSSKVKNLKDYVTFKNQSIDFSEEDFEKEIKGEFQKRFFYKHEFIRNENVFRPRFETELVVEYLVKKIKETKSLQNLSYIDICSGTGAIGISVSLEIPNLLKNVSLLDISEDAVQNIEQNLEKFGAKAEVIKADWHSFLKDSAFEIISSNFPYISPNDPYDSEIVKYDPEIALFAEKDGWYHFDLFLQFLKKNKSWKIAVLECNEFHIKKWQEAEKDFPEFKFEFVNDLNGRFRIMAISRT